jgi:osmotically-inducible protein OsmY
MPFVPAKSARSDFGKMAGVFQRTFLLAKSTRKRENTSLAVNERIPQTSQGNPTMTATTTKPDVALLSAPEQGTDNHLRDEIIQGLGRSGYHVLSAVQCEVQEGEVSLSGVVPSFFMKQIAQTIILRMDSVKRLSNHLEVQSSFNESGLPEPHLGFENIAL